MNNESPRQERILKIFTPVRCMNRDQLLRYQRGQMTDVEKHLVEQHMVGCDLCHDAALALENPQQHEPYERLSHQLSLFIQREHATPVKQQKQQLRPARHVMTRERMLSYFWVVMFIVIGAGSIFLLQEHLKNRPALSAIPVRAAETAVVEPAVPQPEPTVNVVEAPVEKTSVIQTQYGTRDTIRRRTALSAKDSALLKKKPPRDTAKTQAANARIALKAPQPPVAKDTPKTKVEKLAVNTTPIQQEKEEKAPPKEKENEEKEEPAKPAQQPVSGEEAMYRTAMRMQQQGETSEAIDQFKKLTGNDKYSERAKYQLALLYRSKGQNGKARRLFREIVRMDGALKSQAQAALSNSN